MSSSISYSDQLKAYEKVYREDLNSVGSGFFDFFKNIQKELNEHFAVYLKSVGVHSKDGFALIFVAYRATQEEWKKIESNCLFSIENLTQIKIEYPSLIEDDLHHLLRHRTPPPGLLFAPNSRSYTQQTLPALFRELLGEIEAEEYFRHCTIFKDKEQLETTLPSEEII